MVGNGVVRHGDPATPDAIRIRGARQHNLRGSDDGDLRSDGSRGLDVDIPLRALTVVTGVSGSGKSTLAFDTLYAEGQRRYVETFSAYARQFLERMDRPDVESVEGIPPAVAIERSRPLRGSRSTVATLSEVLDHLRLLWAKVGNLSCPGCGRDVGPEDPGKAAEAVAALPAGSRVVIGFVLPGDGRRVPADAADALRTAGFSRLLVGDAVEDLAADGRNVPAHGPVQVAVDRVVAGKTSRNRLVDSFATAFRGGAGRALARVLPSDAAPAREIRFSAGLHCAWCDRTFRPATPTLFSFNSPLGACPACHGFGRTSGIDWDLVVPDPARTVAGGAVKPFQIPSAKAYQKRLVAWCRESAVPLDVPWRDLSAEQRLRVLQGHGAWKGVTGYFRRLERKIYRVHVRVFLSRFRGYPPCADCEGTRLAPEGRAWRVGGRTLPDVLRLDVTAARAYFDVLPAPRGAPEVVDVLLREIRARLACLDAVGLGYLTLDRQARTLSGGEVQRVNLTAAIGTSLVNALFVLDEPSVGLHARDNDRLVRTLRRLADHGNTVVVVEHDPAILAQADHVLEMGPGAGDLGGRVVYAGPPRPGEARATVDVPRATRRGAAKVVGVRGARANNLRGVDLLLRLGEITALSGVSGSGKSSLAYDVLHLALARALGRPEGTPGPHDEVVGAEHVGDVVMVEQAGLNQSSRANPATYVGAWDGFRALFARSPEAKALGFTASTFSFNVPGGRCERCKGEGRERVEMQFLSDVTVSCPECDGTRFRPEVRSVRVDGLSIADVLQLTADAARERFRDEKKIAPSLASLVDVGLGYLRLGQPLSALSSGEAQRLRLAAALAEPPVSESRGTKPRLYLFDEPTTGLHAKDVAVLLRALRRLAERGHGVLLVEHDLDVLWSADRLVDLGPEGGPGGGLLVADGTPEEVARGDGHTARALRAWRDEVPARRVPSLPESSAPAAIEIHGAREHNLRDVTVSVPRDSFVVVSGPSGSGKSTLAFDIVFAEGQRRYIETLSAYARQFVGQLARPDVDHVGGIPPTVAIEQRRSRGGRRSTVATITEVAHFLRLLFARAGAPHCPVCRRAIEALPPSSVLDRVREEAAGREVRVFAPLVHGRKGFHKEVFEAMARRGHGTGRVDGRLVATDPPPELDRYREHDVEEQVAHVRPGPDAREELRAAVEEALALGRGVLTLVRVDGTSRTLSIRNTCPRDGTTVPELDPKFFSHNSRRGWCPACEGLGTRPTVDADRLPIDEDATIREGAVRVLTMDADLHRAFVKDASELLGIDVAAPWRDLEGSARRRLLHGGKTSEGRFVGAAARLEEFLAGCPDVAIDWLGEYADRAPCADCGGSRLRPEARAVQVGGHTLPDLLALPAGRLVAALEAMSLAGRDAAIATPILREVRERVGFLERLGLGYLAMDRDATTLSGGETQRIRLAAQLGSNLRGVAYVLDEPTIGLHARDNARLLDALVDLRRRGNSLLVVEHDAETIRRADHVIDLGPGGGREGGRVVAAGPPAALARDPSSPTGRVLARRAPRPAHPSREPSGWLTVEGATLHNLSDVDVRFPLGMLVAVTGVSGSGKSTLVRDVLHRGVCERLSGRESTRAPFRRLDGTEAIARAVEVDATPVGKTPRSVPATYLGIWDEIRRALSLTEEARARGYGPARFSFNVPSARGGGRCATCEGRGWITVEMSFLPNVETPCEDCAGKRFTPETLEVLWHGRNAGEILAMTFAEADAAFGAFPKVAPCVRLMNDVGLGYLGLGQPSTTLSGGEAQRLKLVTELGRPPREGATLYLLDEPTTGLHGEDVDRLLAVLRRLVDRGDTVVVIEHHLDVIALSDHVIDLGPEGGEGGGRIVAQGSPREVAALWRTSLTGRALRDATRRDPLVDAGRLEAAPAPAS